MNIGRTPALINCDNEFTRDTVLKPTGKIRFRLGTKSEFTTKKLQGQFVLQKLIVVHAVKKILAFNPIQKYVCLCSPTRYTKCFNE